MLKAPTPVEKIGDGHSDKTITALKTPEVTMAPPDTRAHCTLPEDVYVDVVMPHESDADTSKQATPTQSGNCPESSPAEVAVEQPTQEHPVQATPTHPGNCPDSSPLEVVVEQHSEKQPVQAKKLPLALRRLLPHNNAGRLEG